MSRRQKHPLRQLTAEERAWLAHLARAESEPFTPVVRARALLAVADGQSSTAAAQRVGRQSGEAVCALVRRFNTLGLQAVDPQAGRGRKAPYTPAERQRILTAARRMPPPAQAGTATWSLMTRRRVLRAAPDGLPRVSTSTMRAVLHEAGFRWLGSRSWCEPGQVVRRRQRGPVTVTAPEAEAKKT